VHGTAKGSQVTISGGAVPGATGYETQIAEPNGQLWHDSKTPVPSAVYSPVPARGTYHFKMRATNAAGSGPWSPVGTVTVTS
jgi:hypothetical protein